MDMQGRTGAAVQTDADEYQRARDSLLETQLSGVWIEHFETPANLGNTPLLTVHLR